MDLKNFFLVFCLIVFADLNVNVADETPGFFLKVTKNVPRIGRSSGDDLENFFMKQSKSVPRIGRESDRISRDVKNNDDEPLLIRPYNNVFPFDKKLLNFYLQKSLTDPELAFRFISWDDLDKALEFDELLYSKMFNLAKDKTDDELSHHMELGGFVNYFHPMLEKEKSTKAANYLYHMYENENKK